MQTFLLCCIVIKVLRTSNISIQKFLIQYCRCYRARKRRTAALCLRVLFMVVNLDLFCRAEKETGKIENVIFKFYSFQSQRCQISINLFFSHNNILVRHEFGFNSLYFIQLKSKSKMFADTHVLKTKKNNRTEMDRIFISS